MKSILHLMKHNELNGFWLKIGVLLLFFGILAFGAISESDGNLLASFGINTDDIERTLIEQAAENAGYNPENIQVDESGNVSVKE